MTDSFFDKVYKAKGTQETRELYDDWSSSYDAQVAENGYITPNRSARILADFLSDTSTPILDFGCGTGLSGRAFASEGFTALDGMDISPEMLERAKDTGAYRTLTVISPEAPPPIETGTYPVIAAIGVIGAGAAPIEVFDTLMEKLAPGGLMIFSFNDHALADPANPAAVARWTDSGRATPELRDYGDHLPGLGMKSAIYILKRT